MNVRGRDLVLMGGALLLLAVAVVRLAVPDRSRMRPLSVEGLDIPSEPIGQGDAIVREKSWSPPDDVYIVGWNYRIGAPGAGPELTLSARGVRLFTVRGIDTPLNPSFFQAGTGFRVDKGGTVTLRFRLTNAGAAGETHGASALVYFVPVEGN
jgi:hypothetical protein